MQPGASRLALRSGCGPLVGDKGRAVKWQPPGVRWPNGGCGPRPRTGPPCRRDAGPHACRRCGREPGLSLGDGVAVLMLDEAGGVADALDDARTLASPVSGSTSWYGGAGLARRGRRGRGPRVLTFDIGDGKEKVRPGPGSYPNTNRTPGPQSRSAPWAWTAVRTTGIPAISSTRGAARQVGLLRPYRTGPTASAPEG